MIDMGVTDDDGVDPAGIKGKVGVERGRLDPMALKESGIEEDPRSGGLEQ